MWLTALYSTQFPATAFAHVKAIQVKSKGKEIAQSSSAKRKGGQHVNAACKRQVGNKRPRNDLEDAVFFLFNFPFEFPVMTKLGVSFSVMQLKY